MNPSDSPHIRQHRAWGAGLDPEPETPPHGTEVPRGGTIGPPPPLPNPNGWAAFLQAIAQAAQQLAQAAINPQPILNLMGNPVVGPQFVAAVQSNLAAGSPSLAVVAWPYQGTQSPQNPGGTVG